MNLKGVEERNKSLAAGKSAEVMVQGQENAAGSTATSSWRPRLIILSCWNNNTERSTIEHEARLWYNALPQNIKDACLEPCAPRKWGEIADMRVQVGRTDEVYWALARMTENQDNAIRPVWTAVERSPNEGRKRRNVAAATQTAINMLGPRFDFEKIGSIWKGPIGTYHEVRREERGVGAREGWRSLELAPGTPC